MGVFGEISYVLRFNNALALLGVNPQHIKEEMRQSAQTVGNAMGATPQEMALVLASNLPPEYKVRLDSNAAVTWIRKGKANPSNPNVKEALRALGWWPESMP